MTGTRKASANEKRLKAEVRGETPEKLTCLRVDVLVICRNWKEWCLVYKYLPPQKTGCIKNRISLSICRSIYIYLSICLQTYRLSMWYMFFLMFFLQVIPTTCNFITTQTAGRCQAAQRGPDENRKGTHFPFASWEFIISPSFLFNNTICYFPKPMRMCGWTP